MISVFAISVLMLSGCTGLGKLSEGEYLYSGSHVHFDSSQFLANHRSTANELYGIIRQTPNAKFLWMRPFLSIHNMVSEPKKEKGLKYWIKYKLGEAPVKLSNLNLPQINAAMVNRLENRGNFHASVSFEVDKKNKTASVGFFAIPNKPYIIKSVEFPAGSSHLIEMINRHKAGTMVRPGQIYSLSDFIGERNRIDVILKNQGYFYFSPDYMVFDADTSVGQQKMDVKLNLKKDMPTDARVPYFMDRIIVFDDYSLRDYHPDTVSIDNYLYVSNSHQLKPRTILNAVFLEKDSLYSRANHYNTLSHLMGLGVYKYANARFNKDGSTNSLMNAGIYLTPLKKMSLSAEMSASVKTNNYAGPGLKLSFKNRNLFRGAEMLNINLGGRFETQFSGDNVGETSYEITLDGSLTFPRFVPIRFGRKASRQYVPNTIISMGGGLFSRIRLYELHSFNVSLGYTWRTNERVSHLFSPVDVSFTNLAKSSREFEDYLNENPNIRKSFEEQFIIGSSYTFTYSNLHLQTNPTNFYISQMIDLAGNTASAITTALQGSPPSESKQHTLLGVPYSQFVRLRNEMRFFINLKGQNQLGLRLITAGGIPYGNSSVMPYIKQFFVGGTNSVRAFRARTVGPGTYFPSDSLNSIYVDQSGDIKLETSIEYRFPIYGFFKGALFADAGNIWLVNEDKQRPGGEFDIQTFYKQLAVGAGLGFRFDFSFVVIRLDIAFPLRKPYLPEGERWVFKEIQLGSPLWRKQNLVYNVAIGYPF